MLHRGIDLHKRSQVTAYLDAAGPVVKRGSIRAPRGNVQRGSAPSRGPSPPIVECTGSWYWKAIAAAKVKTDPVDAHTLARLLRADLIPEAHMVSAELRPYRDLLRTRLRLVLRRVGALTWETEPEMLRGGSPPRLHLDDPGCLVFPGLRVSDRTTGGPCRPCSGGVRPLDFALLNAVGRRCPPRVHPSTPRSAEAHM